MADKKPAAAGTAAKKELTPRERFLDVAANRVSKVIDALGVVENCSNRRSYEYNEAEVGKAFAAIDGALNKAKKAFKDALEGKTTAPSKAGFKFGS